MLTEKDYCDYDTCVALKELGFNEKCHGYFESTQHFNITSIKKCWCNSEVNDIGVVICPTLYEAQKWLREDKDIIVYPEKNSFGWYCAIHYNVGKVRQFKYSEECDSYEQALLAGIKEAVKILTNNRNEQSTKSTPDY